jgi:predicted NBD/HSP70 family sugar kinase
MHGRGGISGEIGHIVVEENGRPCRCGENRGCLETVASATAIGARISGSGKAPMKLAEAAARVNVDESTRVAFSEAGHAMGSVLASLVSIVGPDRLMLVGPQELVDAPVQPSADYYIKGVLRGLERSAFRAKAQLETRVLDDTAEPRAAASVAVHYFLSEPFRWLPAIGSEPRPVYSVRSTPAVETNAAWEVLVANFGATDA